MSTFKVFESSTVPVDKFGDEFFNGMVKFAEQFDVVVDNRLRDASYAYFKSFKNLTDTTSFVVTYGDADAEIEPRVGGKGENNRGLFPKGGGDQKRVRIHGGKDINGRNLYMSIPHDVNFDFSDTSYLEKIIKLIESKRSDGGTSPEDIRKFLLSVILLTQCR
ncbi:MAG: hypothetical protein AAFO51_00585 [Pseudomonadota bacterium]